MAISVTAEWDGGNASLETWCDMPPFVGGGAAFPHHLSNGDTLIARCSQVEMLLDDCP